MKQIAKISALCFVLSCLFLISSDINVSAQTQSVSPSIRARVTISATLGESVLRLWGYGPSSSRIEMSGRSVSDFTYARVDGYFEFSKAFLPAPSDMLYPELCLTGIDLSGRPTPPTCIPPLPANRFSYDIGPIILPPTFSLDTGSASPLTQVGASGITIPNSEVKIVLAEGDSTQNLANINLISEVKAYYIPNYTVKSDAQGNFSFNMPASTSDKWHVFAITKYSQESTSPKSNTLTFEVVSPTTVALGNIWKIFLSLLTLPVLIFLELLIILITVAVMVTGKRNKVKVIPTTTNPINEYQYYLKSKNLL